MIWVILCRLLLSLADTLGDQQVQTLGHTLGHELLAAVACWGGHDFGSHLGSYFWLLLLLAVIAECSLPLL
eukprot:5270806-Amphidinium_carterae.1